MALENGPEFYQRLIHRGVSRHEIERLYKKLKDRGYGENPSERRFQDAVLRMKSGPLVQEPRRPAREAPSGELERSVIIDIPDQAEIPNGEYWADADSFRRRAEDSLPRYAPALRRTINKWAFRKGLRIVGIRERFRDFLSFLIPQLSDFVNDAFIRELVYRRGFRNTDPADFGLLDTLDSLHETARFFLGKDRRNRPYQSRSKLSEIERNINDTLRRRDGFAYEFLQSFSLYDDKLDRNIESLETSILAGKHLENSELIRLVRQLCRYYYITAGVQHGVISGLLALATDINLAFDKRRSLKGELESAEHIFMTAFGRLVYFHHQLYPALMKMINCFYPVEDTSREKLLKIYGFLQIPESAVLNQEKFRERLKREEEERRLKELEQLEQNGEVNLPEEPFSAVFSSALATLGVLFPGSGIENPEAWPALLPYFDTLVFRNGLTFYHQGQNIEVMNRFDPVGQIMVFHRIIDNLLNSINEFNLEKVLESPSLSDRVISLKHDWKDVYTFLFEPYLETLTQHAREMFAGTARTRELSARIRSREEELNLIRNYCIQDYGNVLVYRDLPRAPRLYLIAEQLYELISGIRLQVNMDLVKAESGSARRLYSALGETTLVEFRESTIQESLEYKPVTHQVQRLIEAEYKCAVDGVPKLAQIRFFAIFHEIVGMYKYLLMNERSFYRTAGGAVMLADPEDEIRWKICRETAETRLPDIRPTGPGQENSGQPTVEEPGTSAEMSEPQKII